MYLLIKDIPKIDIIPLFLSIGISIYFIVDSEPNIFWIIPSFILFFISIIILIFWQNHYCTLIFTIYMTIISVGFTLAIWQANRLYAPKIPHNGRYLLQGEIVKISADNNRHRVLMQNLNIKNLSPQQTPKYIRITIRGKNSPKIGDIISINAILYRPSGALMAGDFNFAKYFYFRQIGAVGFATNIQYLNKSTGNLRQKISAYRLALQEKIIKIMDKKYAAIAIALITGDKTAINDKIKDNFRIAGLAHMLAISGMHMGIITLLLFGGFRLFFSMIPYISIQFNIKKISAIIALIGAFLYLTLANFPVSAIRAYIMIAFLFSGILLDRAAFTRRSLILAACFILIFNPASLTEVGFQLSFAATLGLIEFYQKLGQKIPKKWWFYLVSTSISSLIATISTLPFIIYHFNVIALYGIFVNAIAVPILTFIIMPCLLLAIIGMQINSDWLEIITFKISEFGIYIVNYLAENTANLPHAAIYVPPLSNHTIATIGLGAIFIFIMPKIYKFIGIGLIIYSLSTSFFFKYPDILISANAQYIAIKDGKKYNLIKGKSIRNFTVKNWQERLGVKFYKIKNAKLPDLPSSNNSAITIWNKNIIYANDIDKNRIWMKK